MTIRLGLLFVVLIAACGGPSKPPAGPAGDKVLVNVDAEGVALGGHDPVSYTGEGGPVAGTAEQSSQHGGATYRFATAEHKATFDGDARRHAPQYGGYCAYAASQNRLSPSDPQVWQMYEGQLLMFTNTELRDLFNKDAAEHKRKADENWPGLVAKHGKPS